MKVDVEKNYSRSRVQDGLEKDSLNLFSLLPVSTILNVLLSLTMNKQPSCSITLSWENQGKDPKTLRHLTKSILFLHNESAAIITINEKQFMVSGTF